MLKMLQLTYNQSLPLPWRRKSFVSSAIFAHSSILLSVRAQAATSIPVWVKVAIVATIITVVVGGGVGAGVYFGVVGKYYT